MIAIDVEMPSCCAECEIKVFMTNSKKYICSKTGNYILPDTFRNKRLDNCPLIEIKQSEDCVNRKEMLKEIQEWKDTEFVKMTNPYHYLEKRLSNLSLVIPTHKTYKDIKAFSNELKQRMKERDEDNGGEPLNAVDRGYHLAFEHLCEEADNLLIDFERENKNG